MTTTRNTSLLDGRWQKDVTNLPKERKDFRNNHLRNRSGTAPDVHDHLNELVLDFMKKLVAGDFHPAVRVNAMLMIGELNRVEPSGSDERPCRCPRL